MTRAICPSQRSPSPARSPIAEHTSGRQPEARDSDWVGWVLRAISQPRSTQRRAAPVSGTEEDLWVLVKDRAPGTPPSWVSPDDHDPSPEGLLRQHERIQRLCCDEGHRVLKKAKTCSRGHSPQPRLGHPLPVRSDHQLQDPQALEHHRRIHQVGPFDRRPPLDHRRRHRRGPRPTGRRAGDARVPAQRPRVTADVIRDWCRFADAGTTYIEPGSPWENTFIESFSGKRRDELLNVQASETLLEAQVLAEDFRIEDNT